MYVLCLGVQGFFHILNVFTMCVVSQFVYVHFCLCVNVCVYYKLGLLWTWSFPREHNKLNIGSEVCPVCGLYINTNTKMDMARI